MVIGVPHVTGAARAAEMEAKKAALIASTAHVIWCNVFMGGLGVSLEEDVTWN
jgi:hypothetical protein